MLKLLLKTRIQVYRNFIQYHFNQRTKIYLGIIFVIFMLLVLRSPSDIGYKISYLFESDFSQSWQNDWGTLLPFLYFLFELMAWLTMRSTGEWFILGSFPFPKKEIVHYHLFRASTKNLVFSLIATVPFLFGPVSPGSKLYNFLFSVLLIIFLQLFAFLQAFKLRKHSENRFGRFTIWFIFDACFIGTLILIKSGFVNLFSQRGILITVTVILLSVLDILIFQNLPKWYNPAKIESAKSVINRYSVSNLNSILTKIFPFQIAGLIQTDLLFLIRKRKSVFLTLFIETLVLCASAFSQQSLAAGIVSCLFIQILFSWLVLLNQLLYLFERDAQFASLLRNFPITPGQAWLARWYLTTILVAVPIVFPIILFLLKFSISLTLTGYAVGAFIGIPAALSTIYCNTGFALYPQAKLAGYLMNITLIAVFLFWFYMPFGSIIMLFITIVWIFKSQNHFKYTEMP